MTLKFDIMRYIQWIEGDYTYDDIAQATGAIQSAIYHAIKVLKDRKKTFLVETRNLHQGASVNVYNNVYRPFKKPKTARELRQKGKKADYKERKRQVFHPVDPLRGFVRPVDKTLDSELYHG